MNIIKVVTMCAVNLVNLFKHILMQFGINKIFLLLGQLMKGSTQKLPREDTYREKAASDVGWSAWDTVTNDGLGDSEISAKIEKYAGIADEKFSTEQIMNLTRE
jgi:hypothetical protein